VAYEVTGIEKAAKSEEAKRTGKTPKVSISFEINQHGLLRVKHAEATIDEVVVVPLNVSSTANDTKANTTSTAEESSSSPEPESTDKTEEATGESKDESKEGEAEEKAEEEVKTTNYTEVHRFPLNVKVVRVKDGFAPLDEDSLKNSKEVMDELQSMDDAQAARAQAKNEYEAYIYSQREKMMMSRAEEAEQVASEDVRQSLSQELENAEDWLYDEGENASPEEYKKKQDSLRKQFDPVWFRADELSERPAAIKRARKLIANVTADVQAWNETKPHVSSSVIA
jgi:hypoxia up-regulated 1